jgi:hypothetical protein
MTDLRTFPPDRILAALALPANSAPGVQAALQRSLRASGHPTTPEPLKVSHADSSVVQGVLTQDGERESLSLTLYGAPRTKKTSNQLQRFGGRLKVVPSKAWMRWRDECLKQTNDSMRLRDQPYNLCALFYRDADRGDAIGYLQGLADVLQEAGIVSDDKWFTQFDGSRLLVDRERPRVELLIQRACAGE